MALLKQKPQNDMEEALEKRKKDAAVQEMISSAKESQNAADRQKEKHYAEMVKCVQKKDYKSAERHAKMYMFMEKLSDVSREYGEMLEDQKTMMQTLESLEKINKSFNSLFLSAGSTDSVTAKTIRNMNKFRSYVSNFDSEMDRMLGAMDDMFSDGKKGGKGAAPAEDDEAAFMKLIGSNQELSSRYQDATGPAAAPAAVHVQPSKGSDGDDGFISVGRPD
ncbi:MAG: hypothetical protein LUE27_02290 [Clostridia bacterium]|nr:hypothetical protein [Clostridia bacterium]